MPSRPPNAVSGDGARDAERGLRPGRRSAARNLRERWSPLCRLRHPRLGSLLPLLLAVTVAAVAGQAPAEIPACPGDCRGDGEVTVDDILIAVAISIGQTPLSACPAADANGDGEVTVDDVIAAVNAALFGCPTPKPTATTTADPTPTPPASATATPTVPSGAGERASLFLRCPTFTDGRTGLCHFFTSQNVAFRPFVLPHGIVLGDLYIDCDGPVLAGTQQFVVSIAGADTALGCTVATGADGCTNTADTATYAAGELLAVRVQGPVGATNPTCRLSLAARAPGGSETNAVFTWEGQNEFSPIEGHYCGPAVGLTNDASSCAVSAPEDAAWAIAAAGVVTGLSVHANAALTVGTAATFTLCNLAVGTGACDSTANGLTDAAATLDAKTATATTTTCTVNCAVAAGDRLALKITRVDGAPGPKKTHFAVTVAGVPAHLVFRAPRSTVARYYNLMTSAPVKRPTQYRVDRAGNVRHLYCSASAPPTVDTTMAVCVDRTGVADCDALTCRIRIGERGCSNTDASIPVGAGDAVTFFVPRSGGPGWQGCSVTIATPSS